jgi:hypothetical protein
VTGTTALSFKAGPAAFRDIRQQGFAPERVGTIAGASGGAKWLVLSQIDRVIADYLLPRLSGPVHLIGSSIGTWRFSCYGQHSPLAAIDRFEEAYLSQSYSEKPDVEEITAKGREILDVVLGDSGADEIVTHPTLRLSVLTVRSRFLTATEIRPLLGAGLIMAMTANVVSRRALGAFFARGLFFDARDVPPVYDAPGFPLHRIELTRDNLFDAVTASGSIPLVLSGVRDIAGAPERGRSHYALPALLRLDETGLVRQTAVMAQPGPAEHRQDGRNLPVAGIRGIVANAQGSRPDRLRDDGTGAARGGLAQGGGGVPRAGRGVARGAGKRPAGGTANAIVIAFRRA